MDKELKEALKYVNGKIADLEDDLQHYTMVEKDKCKEFFIREDLKQFTNIQQVLQRLEAIDNSNPSEALKSLSFLKDESIKDIASLKDSTLTKNLYDLYFNDFDNIQQVLVKAQEQKKVLEIIFKKNVDIPYLCELFECIKQGKDTIESALKQYNDSVKNGVNAHQLTEEEFDILKR